MGVEGSGSERVNGFGSALKFVITCLVAKVFLRSGCLIKTAEKSKILKIEPLATDF